MCVERDQFLADRITASLADGSRVVVIAGVFHLWRVQGAGADSTTRRVEADGHRMFTILPFGAAALADPAVAAHLVGAAPGDLFSGGWLREVGADALRGPVTVACDQPPCETDPPLGSLDDAADTYVYLGR